MENWRKYLDPEDMTLEEQMERIIELLAIALRRSIAEEEDRLKKGVVLTEKVEDVPSISNVSQDKLVLEAPSKGRIPFGEQMGGEGREVNKAEVYWIKRIQELSAQGLSSEKIAQQLNQEDQNSKRAGKWIRPTVWRILKRLKEKGVTE